MSNGHTKLNGPGKGIGMIAKLERTTELAAYLSGVSTEPMFLLGDARVVLADCPPSCIDLCMTSPPYWGKREYHGGGIGEEQDHRDFVEGLFQVFLEVRRVLKPTGSLWLNIGDSYLNKGLLGIPWRVAFRLMDEQGWVLRNSVIWNKVKGGPDNTEDRLRNVHENVFHFVRDPQRYFYDVDAIRSNPKTSKVVNGAIVSATGVRGVRYSRQLELSTALNEQERQAAKKALDGMLEKIARGEIADFRMIIRGQQRTTHSDAESVSGRARELQERGFYFLRYHPGGSKPADVWDILPEDTQKRKEHFAPYPEDLCKIPVLATCPKDGVVLDPFCGTGTTMLVARNLGRKSVGIDICREYLDLAQERCRWLL